MAKAREVGAEDGSTGTFQAYFEYNRILRTWFVAFGIGGPALFLVNNKLATRLTEAQQLKLVVVLFLIGGGLQVLGALLNKIANWYMYRAIIHTPDNGTPQHRISEWFIDQFWPDIVIDLGSIGTFGYAAWLLLTVFTKT